MKHLQNQPKRYLPDFLLIPYTLIADERIESLDEKVYAILYWIEHLKGGDCNPSNQEIASIAHANDETGARSIQNSLTRLEQFGYIEREYDDEARRHRIGIHTTVAYKYAPKPKGFAVPENVGTEIVDTDKDLTPAQFAILFFNHDDQSFNTILEIFTTATTASKSAIEAELNRFILYWTEPNKTGTRVRWQLEKTFEVKRRVLNWFSRKKEFAPNRQTGAKI